MKGRIRAMALALLMGIIVMMTPQLSVSAAEPVQEFSAPAYGTRALGLQKALFWEQVKASSETLQETVNAAAALTAPHNVQIINYSDADENRLVYESDGSGVILAMDENWIYISTAAHCLKYAHTIVGFADGTHYEGMAVYSNSEKDTGFVAVARSVVAETTLACISPATGMDAAAAGKVQGDVLYAVSSADGANRSAYGGLLDCYSVVYPNNPQQNVLQFYSTVSHGSSGGAVYTLEGVWIGSVSGGDTYGTCWAVPYSDILNEFNNWLLTLAMQMQPAA